MCLTRASCFCSVHGKAAGEAGQEGGEGLQGRAGQSEEGEPAPRPGRAPHFCGFGRVVLVSSFRVRCAPRLRPRVFSQEPAQGVQWHLPASLPPCPRRASRAKGPCFAFAFFMERPCFLFTSKVLNTRFSQTVWDVGFQPSLPRPCPFLPSSLHSPCLGHQNWAEERWWGLWLLSVGTF